MSRAEIKRMPRAGPSEIGVMSGAYGQSAHVGASASAGMKMPLPLEGARQLRLGFTTVDAEFTQNKLLPWRLGALWW
jgi:hypothetical protein